MLERFLIAVPLICGQALTAGEAKANDCLFELHTTGEANVTVDLREVSTFRVDRQDGGWQINLELKSGKTQWLHLWQEPGARSIEDFQRTVKRCMR
ncbi:MAG: hypothetical protein E6R08_00570 [Nevskiaceae bacterium]|nr:MAG: hypothetical protein E6R08_00570 [Nevskiaceae bacterium]